MKIREAIYDTRPLTLSIHQCIEEVKDWWPSRSDGGDIFMSCDYLRLIQSNPPSSIRPLYAVLRDQNGSLVAAYYLQIKRFVGSQALNYQVESDRTSSWLRPFKRAAASMVRATGLVLGNLLVTGQHGILWRGLDCTDEVQWTIHRQVLDEVKSYLRSDGESCSYILCKDYREDVPDTDGLPLEGVQVQPRMLLDIRPGWSTLEDYLGDMKSKYRKRNRSAIRKAEAFTQVEADSPLIRKHLDRIYELYLDIVQRAPFNMFVLEKTYFAEIKEALGEACYFTLVFHEMELVAFQINLVNEHYYEAHFLGYKMHMVKTHDLYLNLLLNTVSQAIARGMPAIDFSRTAMQIKSSIGAVPEDLYLYVHGHRPIVHRYFARTVESLMPSLAFEQRHPFK